MRFKFLGLTGFLTGVAFFWIVAAMFPPFWVIVIAGAVLVVAVLFIIACTRAIKRCEAVIAELS